MTLSQKKNRGNAEERNGEGFQITHSRNHAFPESRRYATKVGTCGFGMAQAEYARTFSCVEIQHTFYQPPQIKTLEGWRNKVSADFEFVIKAWQLITHEAKSPTFRRLKRVLTDREKQEAGYFKSSTIVKEAWETTLASARALKARTILFQCPASFKSTKENISRLEKFFNSIDRKDLELCWEPRGTWDPDLVRSLCHALALRHVVDPFTGETVTPDHFYFRLHGKNGWRYQYEIDELEELAARCSQNGAGYVFFNNSTMTADALKFCKLLNDEANP
ncbi:MAG TPA: DUF72 domain-containing protein [Pyrinomonadaceae bacterium]